jgi:hypothetical protein
VPETAAILARLDAIMAELAALRAAVAGAEAVDEKGISSVDTLGDDFADGNLLDTTSAAARFGHPRDTVALWCRQGCGVKRGGRWLVSIPRLQRRINEKGWVRVNDQGLYQGV